MKTVKRKKSSTSTENLKLVSKFSISLRKPDFPTVGQPVNPCIPIPPPSSGCQTDDEQDANLLKQSMEASLKPVELPSNTRYLETGLTRKTSHLGAQTKEQTVNRICTPQVPKVILSKSSNCGFEETKNGSSSNKNPFENNYSRLNDLNPLSVNQHLLYPTINAKASSCLMERLPIASPEILKMVHPDNLNCCSQFSLTWTFLHEEPSQKLLTSFYLDDKSNHKMSKAKTDFFKHGTSYLNQTPLNSLTNPGPRPQEFSDQFGVYSRLPDTANQRVQFYPYKISPKENAKVKSLQPSNSKDHAFQSSKKFYSLEEDTRILRFAKESKKRFSHFA